MFGYMKYAGLVCAASVLLGCWAPAGGATYYVDQAHAQANDANIGTDPAAPWRTLDKGLATVASGDTVYVKGSTNPASPDAIYDRSGKPGLGIVTSGAPGNPITFAVWGGHTVILEGNMSGYGIDLTHASHHRINGFLIRKFSKAAEGWSAAADVVIENCEFTQTAQTGLRLRDVTDFVMRDCYVHHCWESGISVRNGFNVTFERVESSYNDDGQGAAGDGDGFHSIGGGDNHTYIDCVARGNSEDGFDLTVNSTLNGCIAEGQTACNIKLWRRSDDNYAPRSMTIINSLVYNAGQAGIKASRGPAVNLYNCVVYNNAEEGVAFRGIEHWEGPSAVTSNIVNCIIAANGWEGIEVLQSGPSTNTVLADHNLYYSNGSPNAGLAADTNAITGLDPLFTGPGVGDFHISPTSPARDNGTTICQVATDFEGQIRPLGASYDIGADEYAPPAGVAGRHIFYNNCYFDGDDPGANSGDDGAIATDKAALMPCQTADFANYTSYVRGINGVMIDIPALPGVPTAADFIFKVGNDNNPAGWSAAPAPSSITIRNGAGAGGADRITIIWADNAIQKQWLQVTVLATTNTGLGSPDVFYFANAIGETGNSASDAEVSPADEVAVRNNTHTLGNNPAAIDDACDFNRDRKVGPTDAIICRNNGTSGPTALKLITVPLTTTPQTVFSDDFNDGEISDWTVTTGGTGVFGPSTARSVSAPYSVHMNSAGASMAMGESPSYVLDLGRDYDISFSFLLPNTNNHWFEVCNNHQVYLVIDSNTDLKSYSPTQLIMTLQTDRWYLIQIKVHPASDTYDVYIDGELKKTCAFWSDNGFETSLRIGDREIGSSDYGEAYWDDFVIEQVPPCP